MGPRQREEKDQAFLGFVVERGLEDFSSCSALKVLAASTRVTLFQKRVACCSRALTRTTWSERLAIAKWVVLEPGLNARGWIRGPQTGHGVEVASAL